MVVAHVGEELVLEPHEGFEGLDFLEGEDVGVEVVDGFGDGESFVEGFGVVDVFVVAGLGGVVDVVEEVEDVVGCDAEGGGRFVGGGLDAEAAHGLGEFDLGEEVGVRGAPVGRGLGSGLGGGLWGEGDGRGEDEEGGDRGGESGSHGGLGLGGG